MSSLAHCLKKLGLAKHEAAILRGKVTSLRLEGYDAHQAAVQAVKDLISELKDERADVVAQIEAQGGAVAPKEPRREEKPEPVKPKEPTGPEGWTAFKEDDDTWTLTDADGVVQAMGFPSKRTALEEAARIAEPAEDDREEIQRGDQSFNAAMRQDEPPAKEAPVPPEAAEPEAPRSSFDRQIKALEATANPAAGKEVPAEPQAKEEPATPASEPNPEQRPATPVAESQAPAPEAGDAGVAPGRDGGTPDVPLRKRDGPIASPERAPAPLIPGATAADRTVAQAEPTPPPSVIAVEAEALPKVRSRAERIAEEAKALTATHTEAGKTEAATPAVVAEAIQKSADNTPFDWKGAKQYLLGEIDKAAKSAPMHADSVWAVTVVDDAYTARKEREGFVTFEVPGDGKFKVRNTKERLAEFRATVEKQFKKPPKPAAPSKTGASSVGAIEAMADDGEYLSAHEYAKLTERPLRYGAGNSEARVAYIDAEPVEILKGHEFFVGRSLIAPQKGGRMWNVIETSTGMSAGSGPNKAAAIASAKERVANAGAEKVREVIRKATKVSQAALEKQWLAWAEKEQETRQAAADAAYDRGRGGPAASVNLAMPKAERDAIFEPPKPGIFTRAQLADIHRGATPDGVRADARTTTVQRIALINALEKAGLDRVIGNQIIASAMKINPTLSEGKNAYITVDELTRAMAKAMRVTDMTAAEANATPEAAKVEAAAAEAAAHPENDKPEPTPAQKEAGNYAMGHVTLHGLDISIETPKGAERKAADGSWRVRSMPAHYGYVKRAPGADGDNVGIFIGPKPELEYGFIINQRQPDSNRFDEHKLLIGFETAREAEDAYRASFQGNFADKVFEQIVGPFSIDALKERLPTLKKAKKAPPPNAEERPADAVIADFGEKIGVALLDVQEETEADDGATLSDDGGLEISKTEVDALRAGLARWTVGKPFPEGSIFAAKLPADLSRLAAAFGIRVAGIGATKDAPVVPNGVFFPPLNTLYLNVKADRPHMAVLGHEFLHYLRQNAPALYEELREAVKPYVTKTGYQAFFEKMRRRGYGAARIDAAKSDYENLLAVNDEIREEFLAEVLADAFLSPAFWETLGRHKPSLLGRVFALVRSLIERARAAFAGYQPRTQDYLSDFDRVMRIAAAVVAKYPGAKIAAEAEQITAKFNAQDRRRAEDDGAKLDAQEKKQPLQAAVGPMLGDLGLVSSLVLHPRQIASLDRDFTPVFRVAERQIERRDQLAAKYAGLAKGYWELPKASRDRVNAVLELDRLHGRPQLAGKTMSAENKAFTNARLSKPGETVTLSDAEKSAYWGVRKMFDAALNDFRDQMLREWGFDPAEFDAKRPIAPQIMELAKDAKQARAVSYQTAASVVEEIEQARRTGYVPFTRWGNVVVRAVDRASGITLWSEKVETGRRLAEHPKVKAAVAALNERYPDARITVFQVADRAAAGKDMTLSDLDFLADVAKLSPEEWDGVREKLADAMKQRGFRKHFFGSANVPGYSADFERAIADYTIGIAGYLSRREAAPDWDTAIGMIPEVKTKLREYADGYRKYVNSPTEELHWLRQIGFFYYLAGVPASALVNMTQVPLITVPYMAQFSNPAEITLQFARAQAEALAMLKPTDHRKIFDPDRAPADVRDAVQRATADGFLLPLVTFEIQGAAYTGSQTARGFGRAFNQVRDAVAVLFTATERFNRLTTFLAAYRVAQAPGFKARLAKVLKDNPLAQAEVVDEFSPERYARWVVAETHYVMGRVNRARIASGPGAAILQFKGFTMQTLELWWRMGKQNGAAGKTAAAASMLALVLLAGAWGFPGADDLRDLVEKLYKTWTKEELDLRTALREAVMDATESPRLAEMFSKGVPAAYGLDLSGRVGMGNLTPDSPLQAAGIPADLLIGRPRRAFQQMANQRPELAVAELLPNFLRNLVQAGSWSEYGVRNNRGKVIIPPEKVTGADVAQKAIGFTPANIARTREKEWAKARMERSVSEIREEFYQRVALARAAIYRARETGDRKRQIAAEADLLKAQADLAAYNKDREPHERIVLEAATVNRRVREEILGAEAKKGRKAARGRREEIERAYQAP